MECIKGFSVLIVVILAFSVFLTESVNAQTIPKPSVPQFSIQVIDNSYDTTATIQTDPYTGQQTTIPSRHITDIKIEGKIKNQPFNQYVLTNPNGTRRDINFFYNVRYKGHFGEYWQYLYGGEDEGFLNRNYSSDYTYFTIHQDFSEGSVIDVQVISMIGYQSWVIQPLFPYPVINGQDSGWSNTLTVTINQSDTANVFASSIDNSPYPTLIYPEPPPTPTSTPTPMPNPTTNPTPTPTVPELSWLVIVPLLLSVFSVAVIFRRRKIISQNKPNV